MPLEPCFPVIQVSLTDFQQLLILEKQKLGNFSFPTHCTTSIFWTARISCLSFTASLCFFTSFFFCYRTWVFCKCLYIYGVQKKPVTNSLVFENFVKATERLATEQSCMFLSMFVLNKNLGFFRNLERQIRGALAILNFSPTLGRKLE